MGGLAVSETPARYAVDTALWPAGAIERWPLSAVLPYAKNAKTHSDAQVAALAASIREWGWTIPVLVAEDGTLIAGHGRVMAARQLGLTEVPVLVARGWSRAQCDAYRIADNKLTEAPWDSDMLSLEIRALLDQGVNLDLLGFSPRELQALLARGTPVGNCDPDFAPGLPQNPITQLGDVWILESGYGLTHRVICGDCTDSAIVGEVLGDVRPHLMVTDPPYGVAYDPAWRNARRITEKNRWRGTRSVGRVAHDDQADWREAWGLFPGYVAYVWHAGVEAGVVYASLAAAGFAVRAQIVWVKNHFAIGRGNYHFAHEPLYYATRGAEDAWQDRYEEAHEVAAYAVRQDATAEWQGSRKQTTVWEIAKNQKCDTGHSTQKPVECMQRPILNNSSAGQAVYEPFLGSGTTVIAGEISGRPVLACEITPAYVDVAVARWCKFTGRPALRAGDGRVWRGEYETGGSSDGENNEKH